MTRKRYGAEFKAKVALDAIPGERTLSVLSAKHGIHQTMIAASGFRWCGDARGSGSAAWATTTGQPAGARRRWR